MEDDVDMNIRSRYRRGWFGESHRHYLAAKGITTAKRYFQDREVLQAYRDIDALVQQDAPISAIRNDLKGNRHMGDSGLARLRGLGFSNEQIVDDPERAIRASTEDGTETPIRIDTIRSLAKKVEKKRQRELGTQQAIYEDELGITPSVAVSRPIPRIGAADVQSPLAFSQSLETPAFQLEVPQKPPRRIDPEKEIGKEITVRTPGVAVTPGVPPPQPSQGFDVR